MTIMEVQPPFACRANSGVVNGQGFRDRFDFLIRLFEIGAGGFSVLLNRLDYAPSNN